MAVMGGGDGKFFLQMGGDRNRGMGVYNGEDEKFLKSAKGC